LLSIDVRTDVRRRTLREPERPSLPRCADQRGRQQVAAPDFHNFFHTLWKLL
jgi:hypothetical protein